MQISISSDVLNNFPDLSIGILIAKVDVKKRSDYVERLKNDLEASEGIQMVRRYDSVSMHPTIAVWRKIYQTFNVNPNRNLSAVESLVKRVVKGNSIWNVSDIVDLYNCISVQTIIPMGAYDMKKIHGNITLRYGVEGEPFMQVGAKEDDLPANVRSSHIVYADEKKILTWLWNYKDSSECCINLTTKYAIFFADMAQPSTLNEDVMMPISLLEYHLQKIGADVIYKTKMNAEQFHVKLPSIHMS